MKFRASKRVLISTLLLTILNIVFITYQVLNGGDYFLYGTLCFIFQFLIFSVYFIPNTYFYEIRKLLDASFSRQKKLERNYSDLEQKITRYFELIKSSNEEQKKEFLVSFNKVNASIEAATAVFVEQNENLLRKLNQLESGINNGPKSSARELDEKFHLVSEQGNQTRIATLDSISQLAKMIENESSTINENIGMQQVSLETQFRNQLETIYARLDALMSIHHVLDLNSPLPIMQLWSVSSDYALDLVGAVIEKGEGSVIDIGSGISTILMGYAIQINGNGKVIALEHSEEFFQKTRKLIIEHKLEDFCEVHLCPLIIHKINGKECLWYDIGNVRLDKKIALISVDGPKGDVQELARYPAVPILEKYIDNHILIYLDDGDRQDEKIIASMWEKEYKLTGCKYPSHRGYFKFSKAI